VRILTPDVLNYGAMEQKMLLNEPVEKAPLIVHSLDLNFSMLDL
jgi:Ni,Fe-hydrogenase III large subunit